MKMTDVVEKVSRFRVEVPSWGFSRSGTRFHAFQIPGEARTLEERISDAGTVARLTGGVSSVAIHIPWDIADDYDSLKQLAESSGISIGAVNPNLFQEEDYLFGSLTNTSESTRDKATRHCLDCVNIMRKTGSKSLSLWLPDGSNYPGQVNMTQAFDRLLKSLNIVYGEMDSDMQLLIEYKFFEPAFYHTVLCDWGTALLVAERLGERARILVDLGHHAQGTNIEYIVGLTSMLGKLGGFHFNSRKYADDDLTVGSINPYELFLVFVELNSFYDLTGGSLSLVIDQSHNVKSKIAAMIQSVVMLQKTYAKSLLVDRDALERARKRNNVIEAEEILLGAFETDVRPIIKQFRQIRDLPEDPLDHFFRSGLHEKIVKARSD